MNKVLALLNGSGKAALFALSLIAFAPAHAGVVVDHSNGGNVSGSSWTNMGGTTFTVWDDFTLTSGANIDGITYFTANSNVTFTRDYTLMIGTAAGKSDVYNQVIANSAATHTIGVVKASFAPLNLGAGTYWLTFNSGDNLYGSAAVVGASLDQRFNGASNIRIGSASSFILTGSAAVPEPGSLALLGLGLFGFAVSRRKSRK